MSGEKVLHPRFPSLTPEETEKLDAHSQATRDLGTRVTALHSDVTSIKGQLPEMKRSIDTMSRNVQECIAAVVNLSKQINTVVSSGSLPPMRPEAKSYHGFDGILADARDVLVRRVKDPKDPLNEERAAEIAAGVFARLGDAKDAHAFREVKKTAKSALYDALKYVAVGAVGAAGYYIKTKLGL